MTEHDHHHEDPVEDDLSTSVPIGSDDVPLELDTSAVGEPIDSVLRDPGEKLLFLDDAIPASAEAGIDPAAPWPDDDAFSHWVRESELDGAVGTGDDLDHLFARVDEGDMPGASELIEWVLGKSESQ